MRIPGHDPYRWRETSLPDVNGAQGEASARASEAHADVPADRIEISDHAKDLSELYQRIAALPDVRAARVAEIAARLADGTYAARSEAIAKGLIKAAVLERL